MQADHSHEGTIFVGEPEVAARMTHHGSFTILELQQICHHGNDSLHDQHAHEGAFELLTLGSQHFLEVEMLIDHFLCILANLIVFVRCKRHHAA